MIAICVFVPKEADIRMDGKRSKCVISDQNLHI